MKKIEKIIDFLVDEIGLNPFTNQKRLAYVLYQALDDESIFNKKNNRMFLKHAFRTYQSITYDFETRYGAFERSIYRYIEELIPREYVDFHLSVSELVDKYKEKSV